MHDLRLLAVVLLQRAAHQQVEFLVGAAELDVGLQRDGVVALHQRIQEFVQRDGLVALVALAEVVALEHARDGVARGDLDELRRAASAPNQRELKSTRVRFAVEDLEDLLLVGARVRLRSLRASAAAA